MDRSHSRLHLSRRRSGPTWTRDGTLRGLATTPKPQSHINRLTSSKRISLRRKIPTILGVFTSTFTTNTIRESLTHSLNPTLRPLTRLLQSTSRRHPQLLQILRMQCYSSRLTSVSTSACDINNSTNSTNHKTLTSITCLLPHQLTCSPVTRTTGLVVGPTTTDQTQVKPRHLAVPDRRQCCNPSAVQ